MNVHDDAFFDDVAMLALGVLPDDEAHRLADHVRTCAQCREVYSPLRCAADRVGFAAEEAAGADALTAARRKKRLMAAVRESIELPVVQQARPRRAEVLPWTAVAAAILLAVGLGIQNVGLRHANERADVAARLASARQTALTAQLHAQHAQTARIAQAASAAQTAAAARLHEQHTRMARLAQENSAQHAALAARLQAERVALRTQRQAAIVPKDIVALLDPSAKRYAVSGGVVIARNGKLFIALHGLAQPPAHKVYQAWTLKVGAKKMTPGATFRPDADGIALIELRAPANETAAVALSVEPAGGSPAPTTKPAFVRKLS